MSRSRFTVATAAALLLACGKESPPPEQAQPPSPAPGTPEWKIQNATSAAPAAIASNATIMDWPAQQGGQPTQLRAGTNSWTCFPDEPNTPSNDPMCLDQVFLAWADAWLSKKTPQLKQIGYAYMLQGGEGSNTDPYAMQATPDNQWGKAGPHLMIVAPNFGAFGDLTTDMNSGGPWLMWKGTPYAHVMVPISQ